MEKIQLLASLVWIHLSFIKFGFLVSETTSNKLNFMNFLKHENSLLDVKPIQTSFVQNSLHCAFLCAKENGFSFNVGLQHEQEKVVCQILATDKYKDSVRFLKRRNGYAHYSILNSCENEPCSNGGTCIALYNQDSYKCSCPNGFSGDHCQIEIKSIPELWTLIARFSNADAVNWMKSDGSWWYDVTTPQGNPASTTANQDMISAAFWNNRGHKIKITRTDDETHTPLLVTTSDCLGGQTFRQKMTSFGDFRNEQNWGSIDKCLGSCDVTYSGNYTTTGGFSQANCDGSALLRSKVGFWCHIGAGAGAGAVMSIGGVGPECDRADHGLGVTEQNQPKFTITWACDFGDDPVSNQCEQFPYALNLWIL